MMTLSLENFIALGLLTWLVVSMFLIGMEIW
jgi:hypothetical protein